MRVNIFIIGSKGIPANYGGFETFVDELVSSQVSKEIKYHVSCLVENLWMTGRFYRLSS